MEYKLILIMSIMLTYDMFTILFLYQQRLQWILICDYKNNVVFMLFHFGFG